MGKCIYCQQNAGFFAKRHKECEKKYLQGITAINEKANQALHNPSEANFKEICELSSEANITAKKMNEVLANIYSDGLERFLDDGVLSVTEEKRLQDYSDLFRIPQEALEKNNALNKTIQASIIRDLLNGNNIGNRIEIKGGLPFKLMKSENLIYLFQDVELYEQKIKTTYEGGSQGVSLRVTNGVYYRLGSFKAKPVQTMTTVPVTKGILAFTDKHIYFSSSLKNFRIKFDKIITVEPFSDAVAIQKDGVSSKPQIFKNVDGWFCYNFLQNI